MDNLEKIQTTDDSINEDANSFLPYDHVEAYRYLTNMGLKNIKPPKLVDDAILDR